jgi:hypothetical protein
VPEFGSLAVEICPEVDGVAIGQVPKLSGRH